MLATFALVLDNFNLSFHTVSIYLVIYHRKGLFYLTSYVLTSILLEVGS